MPLIITSKHLRTHRRVAAAMLIAVTVGVLDGNGRELPPESRTLAFATAPSRVDVSPDGREILVVFPGPLADGEADRVAKSLGPLLEGYAEGFGAVRFRLTTPARATLASPATVDIVPNPDIRASDEDVRRLDLLQARAEAQDGHLAAARVRLQGIVAERPGDIEPLLALAETETSAGRWQHALGLYDGLGRLYPEATDIFRDRNALSVRHAPSLRVDVGATFGPNGERAQTATLTGEIPIAETWRAGISLQTVHDEVRGLRRSGSTIAADYSDTKLLAGLSVAHDWGAPTNTTRLNLFAAPATIGASINHDVSTRFGETTASIVYHQPFWGTLTAFAANARRDQVGVAQTIPLPDQWQIQAGAGVVRYGLPSHEDVATGPTLLAGFSRGLPERWMPLSGMQTRLGYRLEAEYLGGTATGLTTAGYLPLLDVRRREVHSVYAETTAPIGPANVTALIGYALDRFGGGGPQALLRATSGEDSDRLTFSAEAGIEPSLDINPRNLFHVSGSLVWRFGGP